MRRSPRSWLWRVPLAQEVDEELAFHLEMRARELEASGMTPEAARRAARARLGDLTHVRQACLDVGRKRDRDMRLRQWLDEFQHDVRFALRQMRSAKAFTLVAVLTLALGIGANSAIFALVDAALLRPLPFRDPDRVVMLWERTPSGARSSVSPLNLADWTTGSRTLTATAGYMNGMGGMAMRGRDGASETVTRQWVSSRFFEVLGIAPVAGRMFEAADDYAETEAVVLSEGFWRTRFAGDPSIIGRTLGLDGEEYRVLGVVPSTFRWTHAPNVWGLIRIRPQPQLRTAYIMNGIGRLAPGAPIEAARADVSAVAAELARTLPENRGRGVEMLPVREGLVGSDVRVTSMLFLGVVGFVLLICCTNVANLLLARATARSRELAIRAALGAGRGRVARQLVTESLVLAVLGGTLGAAVGAGILAAAPAIVPAGVLPPSIVLTFDLRVVGFSIAAALAVGVLFGLAPAWQTRDLTAPQVMAADTRTTTGGGARLRSGLVVVEVATAVLLLVGAGLLLRTLLAVEHVDRGYRSGSILTMAVDPLGAQYPTPESLQQFYDDVAREVRALPGVADVAWASTLPLGESFSGRVAFSIVGEPLVDDSQRPAADQQIVSASYFETVDLPIVAGRAFTAEDARTSPLVCIVNEAFARKYLPGRNPIGQRVAAVPLNGPKRPPVVREIVGVARQVKARPDETSDLVQIYQPMTQGGLDDIFLFVRPASGPATALVPSVRAAIGRIDTAQLVSLGAPATLDEVAYDAASAHRFRATLVMAFAGLALVLAMAGVFGILAYSVQQRGRDFAVRRALGATGSDVLWLVARGAGGVVATGAALGGVASIAATRAMTSVLFGVSPVDPMTLVGVTVLLGLAAVAAVAGPAWRASRIDPAAVLRGQ